MNKYVACCDSCGTILNDTTGIRIEGNIFVAGEKPGGLIGNNIMVDENSKILSIKSRDFCAKCFISAMTDKFIVELSNALCKPKDRTA